MTGVSVFDPVISTRRETNAIRRKTTLPLGATRSSGGIHQPYGAIPADASLPGSESAGMVCCVVLGDASITMSPHLDRASAVNR